MRTLDMVSQAQAVAECAARQEDHKQWLDWIRHNIGNGARHAQGVVRGASGWTPATTLSAK
eukprot:2927426-Pyramimonas_sp.AAC.1